MTEPSDARVEWWGRGLAEAAGQDYDRLQERYNDRARASIALADAEVADFHAAFYILNKDIAFVGTHWEAFPDEKAGCWPALCVHVSSYGADAEEVPREHWRLLADMTRKHGDCAGEAYACWRRNVDEPGKGKLSAAGRAALAEFRAHPDRTTEKHNEQDP